MQFDNTPTGRAEQLLARHQFWDAYKLLNDLIEQGNDDAHIRRLKANAELNMGMGQACIDDCTIIVDEKCTNCTDQEIKNARTIRATAYIRMGQPEKAEPDAEILKDNKLQFKIRDLKKNMAAAENLFDRGEINEACEKFDLILRDAPFANDIRLKRAEIAWDLYDYNKYAELTKDMDDTKIKEAKFHYRKALINFCKGDMNQARLSLSKTKGLRNIPSNVSVLNTKIGRINVLLSGQISEGKVNELETIAKDFCPTDSVLYQNSQLQKAKLLKEQDKHKALELLNDLVTQFPNTNDFLIERGELNLELKDYDAAVFDFQTCQRRGSNDKRVQENLQKALQMQKEANRVDYYEILGVDKHATTPEITKAFKKCVREWHPDRFADPDKKKEAEQKMKQINIAYDILGDKQKRQMYDAGQDPDQPGMNGGGAGFNPFDMFFKGGQTFQGFQGNNGQFHFEFRFG